MANILHTAPRAIFIEIRVTPEEFRKLADAAGGSQFALKAMRLSSSRWLRQLEHECKRAAARPGVARSDAHAKIPA